METVSGVGMNKVTGYKNDTPDTTDWMVGGDHYLQTKVQPWEVIASWAHEAQDPFEAYLWGNVIKYIYRYRRKGNPNADIAKAIHYLKKLEENLP